MAPAMYASEALTLIVQEWSALGTVADKAVAPTGKLEVIVDRITALLVVRLAAIVAPLGTYPDLSIAGICRSVLVKDKGWPPEVTPEVVAELKEFVSRMVKGYKDADEIYYHNREHCYHVVLSACKLMDMFLANSSNANSSGKKGPTPPSFGLRNDPVMLFSLAFAALIHDVEHQGIPNRQLSVEKDRLAVLYNDQSIAENWSLYVGFSELLQDDFANLRSALFLTEDVYAKFRRHVINLVLSTDIASPERTQIGKSKWKEAFGDPYETVERKVRAEMRRASLGMTGHAIQFRNRRGSTHSELSVDEPQPASPSPHHHRGGGGDDDEDSLSVTPENSVRGDDDDDINNNSNIEPPSKDSMVHMVANGVMTPSSQHAAGSGGHRRRSSASAYERRMSAASRASTVSSKKYRYRLGILRTVDLSGETHETYSRGGSIGHATAVSSDHAYSVDLDFDEPDELKATVVLETIMTAADVGHNLQGWEQMIKWSSRLYMELRKAHITGRGFDAQPKWFENQIGFLESYLLPLAHRLEDMGVFQSMGPVFAEIVEGNRDRWLTEGYDVTQKLFKDGEALLPSGESAAT